MFPRDRINYKKLNFQQISEKLPFDICSNGEIQAASYHSPNVKLKIRAKRGNIYNSRRENGH